MKSMALFIIASLFTATLLFIFYKDDIEFVAAKVKQERIDRSLRLADFQDDVQRPDAQAYTSKK